MATQIEANSKEQCRKLGRQNSPLAASLATGMPLLVRVEEAAALCSLSRSRMYELIQAGEIVSVGIGRSRRIPLEALKQWIDRMSDEQSR